jgi:hypothetical protein
VDEARRLIAAGAYRAAAALLGVVLEHDLRRFIGINGKAVDARGSGRPLGLGQSVRLLRAAGLLAKEDTIALEQTAQVRNRAVHMLEEPTDREVLSMLDTILLFRDKYMGNR